VLLSFVFFWLPLKRKDNSSQNHPSCFEVLLCCHIGQSIATLIAYPSFGEGILTFFPFGTREFRYCYLLALSFITLSLYLRADSLLSNCCSQETFFHFNLQRSHLNTCYYYLDLHRRPFHLDSHPEASTLLIFAPSYSWKFLLLFTSKVEHKQYV